MTEAPGVFAVCGAVLVAVGLYGLVMAVTLIQRIVGFNIAGSGLFVILGALARRDPGAAADPVRHALIITGIVVALAASALALGIVVRLAALRVGSDGAAEDEP